MALFFCCFFRVLVYSTRKVASGPRVLSGGLGWAGMGWDVREGEVGEGGIGIRG